MIPLFDLPEFFARLGIQSDHVGIELRHEDLALSVGETAVDRITASHRRDVRTLLRRIHPFDRCPLPRQVEGIDNIGETRVHIHRGADH